MKIKMNQAFRKNRFLIIYSFALLLMSLSSISAQNVGINTTDPDAPLHIFSSGQVQWPNGLMVLGNRTEAHMKMDFNYLQSKYSESNLDLGINPEGGKVGIGTQFPKTPFHVFSSGQVLVPGGLMMLGNATEANLRLDFNRMQAGFGASNYITLFLQPDGGDMNMSDGLLYLNKGTGFIGAGTTNPQARFQIEGVNGDNAYGTRLLRIRNGIGGELFTTRANGSIGIGEYSPPSATRLYIKGLGSSPATKALEIKNDQLLSLMTVLDDGKVGIGTSSPSYLFDVKGDMGIDNKIYHNQDIDTYFDLTTDRIKMWAGGHTLVDAVGLTNTVYLGNGWDTDINLNTQFHLDGQTGFIGIGTSAPYQRLHVHSGSPLSAVNQVFSGGYFTVGQHGSDHLTLDNDEIQSLNGSQNASTISINAKGGDLLLGDDASSIAIGGNLPSTQLHLRQQGSSAAEATGMKFQRSGDNSYWRLAMGTNYFHWYYNGSLKAQIETGDGSWSATSDLRMKRDIETLPSVLSDIKQLRPVRYHMIEDANPGPLKHFGFIAQEVDEVFPEAVRQMEDHLGLTYSYFSVIAIKGIQEQQIQIENLQNENIELKQRLERLEKLVQPLLSSISQQN